MIANKIIKNTGQNETIRYYARMYRRYFRTVFIPKGHFFEHGVYENS